MLTSTAGSTLEKPASLPALDTEILSALDAIVTEVTRDIEEYRLYMAAEQAYHYVWHELADKILEESKAVLAGEDGEDASAKAARRYTLVIALTTSLQLLHPFMPFVTEAIWQLLPKEKKTGENNMLMTAKWPSLTK